LPVVPPPAVKLDRVAAVPLPTLQGQVVWRDRVPAPGTQVLFVKAGRQDQPQAVTADSAGNFRVTLASGGWLVYANGSDNRPIFHSKIQLRDNETRQVLLVAR
jgi:hypothetical protein